MSRSILFNSPVAIDVWTLQKKGMKAGSIGHCYSIAYTKIMKSQCCTVFTIQHLQSRDLYAAKGGHICLHQTSTCLMQLTPSLSHAAHSISVSRQLRLVMRLIEGPSGRAEWHIAHMSLSCRSADDVYCLHVLQHTAVDRSLISLPDATHTCTARQV